MHDQQRHCQFPMVTSRESYSVKHTFEYHDLVCKEFGHKYSMNRTIILLLITYTHNSTNNYIQRIYHMCCHNTAYQYFGNHNQNLWRTLIAVSCVVVLQPEDFQKKYLLHLFYVRNKYSSTKKKHTVLKSNNKYSTLGRIFWNIFNILQYIILTKQEYHI